LTPEQRRTAMGAAGLSFGQLTAAQQQQFVAHLGEQRASSMEELPQMTIRVEYLQPGEFQWVQPGMSHCDRLLPWPANYFKIPTARGRTRDSVLQAARRIDPSVDATQIHPTEFWLAIIYGGKDPRTGRRFEYGRSGTAQGADGTFNW